MKGSKVRSNSKIPKKATVNKAKPNLNTKITLKKIQNTNSIYNDTERVSSSLPSSRSNTSAYQ
jgi:hypothetical protein